MKNTHEPMATRHHSMSTHFLLFKGRSVFVLGGVAGVEVVAVVG